MFDNIGGKIKKLAEVTCWIGIIAYAITGIVLWVAGLFWYGLIVVALGGLMSWVGSFIAYGLGELIENTSEIKKILSKYKMPERDYEGKLTQSAPKINTVSKLSSVAPVSKPNSTATVSYWVCPKCGRTNKSTDRTCKDCGTYK